MSVALVATIVSIPQAVHGGDVHYGRHTREYFRHNMAASVRSNHPAILPVAAAIRAVTTRPLEQIVMVNDVTHLLVDYDDDERVYGAEEFHATFDEMLSRRRHAGWLYLRDDCDGRAVFAAHLLSALGIPWRLEASYWKEHAWVVARVGKVDYDLLDLRRNAPETNRLSYKLFGHMFVRASVRPPSFAWRRTWAQRTGRDLASGLALGLLTVDSNASRQRERYAMDWSRKSPSDQLSPVDDRALSVSIAGFPYGEPLHVGAIATVGPIPKQAQAPALGVATGSPNSTTP
ncbi:MAG: hypothetical protein ACREH8_06030 [Opitutaceae bacterium]